MYFEGSVKGLSIGSPVVFRGVRIGSVKNIVLQFDAVDLKFLIPVYVEINLDKIVPIKGLQTGNDEDYMKELIKKGLRAQLEMQSMVTGQLMVNIDFFPKTTAKFVGVDKRYREIPTLPSGLDNFLKQAQEIPLKELVDKVLKTIESIDRRVNSDGITTSIDSLSEGLSEAKTILKKVDKEIDPILANLKDVMISAREIIKNGEAVPEQIGLALTTAHNTLKQAEKTLLSAQGIASENSTVMIEIQTAIQELSKTTRSVRYLTDYLQRHPEALLSGKKTAKGE
jgi:paraquat-inducible protein B